MSETVLNELKSVISESLSNLWIFTHEKALQVSLITFSDIQKKATMNVEFEQSLMVEKQNADKFYSSMINNSDKKGSNTTKETDGTTENWRDK